MAWNGNERTDATATEPGGPFPSDAPEAAAPLGRTRRTGHRRYWIAVGVLVMLAGWFAHFAYLRIARRPTPQPEYWETQLAALDPPPPGAIPWPKTLGLISARPWAIDPAIMALKDFDVSNLLAGPWDEKRPDVAAAIAVFRSDAFEKVRADMARGTEAGWCEPTSLVPNAALSSLVQYRAWARWLVARSRWIRMSRPDNASSGAIEDWLTAFRLARQMRRSQAIIYHLIEEAIDALVAREMILASKESAEAIDTCGLARRIDEVIGPPQRPVELLRGEVVWLHCLLDYIYVRDGGDWLDVSECARRSSMSGNPPWRIWNLASPLFHDWRTAHDSVGAFIAEFDKYEDIAACARERNSASESLPLDGMGPELMGSYVSFVSTHYRTRCLVDAALGMLAIEEYHRRIGEYPARLADLVPEFLPRLPIDYVDRQPLRYRRTGSSYLFYSIGLNGKDDGGEAASASPEAFNASNPDVVFSAVQRRKVDR